jgi:hypothetical protein
VSSWIGEKGKIKKLSCQYRNIDYPRKMASMTTAREGESWWCKGRVTRKYVQNGEHIVECDVWVEDGGGRRTTQGRAIAALPSKETKGR